MKALIIDDSEMSTLELSHKLEMYDVEVISCTSGAEGIFAYESSGDGEYDIIFLDIMMPDKKGTEVSSHIRSCVRKDAKEIPIIAVTGINYDVMNRAMDVSGFNALLQKPIDMKALKNILDAVRKS